jgi:F420-dependent oxidoreductase-like protein
MLCAASAGDPGTHGYVAAMRCGVMVTEDGLGAVLAGVRRAADAGLATAWLWQAFGIDALTALAVAGREVPRIELGTSVVPTYPRHPVMMASQALTTQTACGGRLALGIGLSHRVVIERVFGQSYDRPVAHLRDYLTVLQALVHDGRVRYEGETLRAATFSPVRVDEATPFPILVAALGPQLLRVAGTLADGTITWMAGLATVADHVVPSIAAAARAAERPSPRVVVGLPVCVTSDVDAARVAAVAAYAHYDGLPSYRAMLDREGAAGPADVAVIGDEETVARQLAAFVDAGTTDVLGSLFGTPEEQDRTLALLGALTAS